jgi:hypothetical protein
MDLAIQTMAAGPYGLLLSNVNVGYGSRPWGQMGTVQSASSFMTVWNMNSQVKVCWHDCFWMATVTVQAAQLFLISV